MNGETVVGVDAKELLQQVFGVVADVAPDRGIQLKKFKSNAHTLMPAKRNASESESHWAGLYISSSLKKNIY